MMTELPPSGDVTVVADVGSDSEPTTPSSRFRSLLLFCWALLAMGMAIGAWSIATPLMQAPDEPGHAINAAAVVRGEFDVREHPTYLGPVGIVQVPAWAASTIALPACLVYFPTLSAGCEPRLNNGTKTVESETQFSHYPPLYYLFVGIPSLLAKGVPALYEMRMVGTLLNSALIALGLFLVSRYHPRRSVFAGVLIALTPMVFFLASVLNASGMEIAAAFAAWCGGLCVMEHRPVPPALAGWTALAFAVLVLSRPDSPANAAVIIVTLGVLAGWSRCKELARERWTLPIRLSIVLALIVAVVQLVIGGFPPLTGVPIKPRLSMWGSIWLTLRLTEYRLRQGIGNFGWLNTPVPEAIFALWTAVVAAVVAAGLYLSSRCRRALPVLVIAIIAMPIILESPRIDTIGTYWQGRYWLPLLIGVPLVAASQVSARKRASDRTVAVTVLALGFVLAIAQVWAFVAALDRYEYGLGAGPHTIGRWAPPGGSELVIGLFVFGIVLLQGFTVFNCIGRGPTSRIRPAPDLVTSAPLHEG